MYQTCLFCSQDLGENQVLEPLPIGQRIVFDEAQGRLWIVCRKCERWNLVPFDSRLEAIDACARLYRTAHLRFSTDNIGIARLDAGLELVRIGAAERQEFAAWRYGDQFGRRRRRAVMYGAAGALAAGGVLLGGFAVGASLGMLPNMLSLGNALHATRVIVARIPQQDGIGGALSRRDLAKSRLRRNQNGSWELRLHLRPWVRGRLIAIGSGEPREFSLRGERAVDALGFLLPALNRSGGSRSVVADAVALVEHGDSDSVVRDAMTGPGSMLAAVVQRNWKEEGTPLHAMSVRHRLAIEMITHESSERSALAGELKLLERKWREADELAKISDALALPEGAEEELERHRKANLD